MGDIKRYPDTEGRTLGEGQETCVPLLALSPPESLGLVVDRFSSFLTCEDHME